MIKKGLRIVLLLGIIYFIVSFLNGYYSERVEVYIENEARNYAMEMVEKSLREEVINKIEVSDILIVNEKSIIVNTKNVNEIVSEVNKSLNNNIDYFENVDDLKLPIGIVLSETLSPFGPDINIDIYPISSFKTDLVTSVEEYGINNSLFKVEILVSFEFETLIPLNKNQVEVECKIPLVTQIIQGEVPYFYSYGKNDTLVPIGKIDE